MGGFKFHVCFCRNLFLCSLMDDEESTNEEKEVC